ncbi:hypothetical protein [Candidatus Methylobacter oryzae]|uniref:hypothetical protein n=1 Tax=Candidatus Methylobacter oryzae TaxID=2497749 RepID=UPI00117DD88C|nr:hypothetical protein [Candidatus Methylobacter oryzae]
MFLLLILPILVSGYSTFTQNPYHYYRLHRYEGQLLYLESVKIGLNCTLVSAVVTVLLNSFAPPSIKLLTFEIPLDIYSFVNSLLKKTYNDSDYLAWVFIITVGSLAVSYLYVCIAKIGLLIRAFDVIDALSWRRIKVSFKRRKWLSRQDESHLTYKERTRIILMASVLKDSPIDALFLKSYVEDGFFVMLTMEDRKVYIGRVISLGEPNETEGMDQEIAITPYASGYRDKDSLNLVLTTKYKDISEDVSLILKQDKIISATHFSESVYDEFQHNQIHNQRLILPKFHRHIAK